jgi:hypothetical protein
LAVGVVPLVVLMPVNDIMQKYRLTSVADTVVDTVRIRLRKSALLKTRLSL